jgi:hypothetical protein
LDSLGVRLLNSLSGPNTPELEVVEVNLPTADKNKPDGTSVVETLAEAPLRVDELVFADGDIVRGSVAGHE